MKTSSVLALGIGEAFDWLDQVVSDLTPEQYAWQPPGSANRIDKLHAHTLSGLDFWMNLMGLSRPMLWPAVSQKTGLPSNFIEIWQTDQPINLSDMQAYAKDLRESGLPAVEALDDDALARSLQAPVFGKRDVGFVIRLAAAQLSIHTGEISATKGLQGLRGLPF